MNATFYAGVRSSVFGGSMTQGQVDGCEVITKAWEKYGDGDTQKLAYLLATAFHETARTMQPIYERGNGDGPDADKWDDYLEKYDTGKLAKALGNSPEADGDGVLYAGRGYVQLTGLANYKKASAKLGVDLVKSPAKALDPDIAARILISGCMGGWFTGKRLHDYIDNGTASYIGARRVVNGQDKAKLIAGYAVHFEHALEAAAKATKPVTPPEPETPASEPPEGFWGALFSLLNLILSMFKKKEP